MKKKIFIIFPILICLLVFLGVYFFFYHEDKDTSLTISEKRWIENNSLTKVNLDIVNDMPVFGENGVGVLFEFAKDFELETDLEFNKIPYSKTASPTSNELQFRLLNNDANLTDKDLLLYEDGYVLLGHDNIRYDSVSSIKGKTIAALSSDVAEFTYYMKGASDITYKTYETLTDMILAFSKKEVDMILVPQITYLKETFGLEGVFTNYYFAEFSKKVVLTLTPGNEKLNSIVKKYFQAWKGKRYVKTYNEEYLDYYVSIKNMSDKVKADMLSKTYIYGYVENAPYEVELDKEVLGIAGEYIQRMVRLTGIDIKYKSYRSRAELMQAVKNKEVDIYFDVTGSNPQNYSMTISPFVEKFIVLGNATSSKAITSLESLKQEEINVLDNNVISQYLKNSSKAKVTPKVTIDALKEGNRLIVIDKEIYDYYKNSKFKNYINLYEDSVTTDYYFGVSNTNSEFYQLFNYLIGTNSYYNYRIVALQSLQVGILERTTFTQLYLIILGFVLLPILLLIFFYLFIRKKKEVNEVRKEERRKYTDLLTSLKNRNYLNFNMERWENSKVYPQAMIVVDLNNVSYVNDNYGHEEGDKLIIKAASILVNTQLENSEIMRTDGNEFLIYLVGYTEKQVETYTKKLTKELKELPHGFGAAVGYSVILDDIKTIDDAINEASLDMKTKKEELR